MDGKVEMDDQERDRKLDQWLDDALSQYSAAEPRLGLEQRVLKHVRAEQPARTKWNLWRWMPAFAALAAAVIVAVAVGPSLTTTQRGQLKSKEAAAPIINAAVVTSAPGQAAPPAQKLESRQTSAAPLPATVKGNGVSHPGRRGVLKEVPALPAAAPETVRSTEMLPGPVDIVPKTHVSSDLRADGVALPPVSKSDTDRASQSAARVSADDTQVPSGIIGTEKLTSLQPLEVPAKQPKKAKRQPAPAATASDSPAFDVYGVKVRTEIVRVPIGPIQQFPSPAPLSEQEKSVLAAGPKLKDKQIQPSSGDIAPVQIKEVEIAPLETPKK